jgi:hypothetical protein
MALIKNYAQMRAAYPQNQHWNEVLEMVFRSPNPAVLNLSASQFLLDQMATLLPQGKLINTCCIRISHVLNQVGANKITKNTTDKIRYFPGCANRTSLSKGSYILAVREMSTYMRTKYGAPLSILKFKPGISPTDALMWKKEHGDAKKAEFMAAIALKTGIVVLFRPGTNVGGTGTFSGHVDLWDMGQAFHDDSVTDSANQIEFWAVD